MKNRKGFTLIELLAVILILGVIALIAIPSVNNVIRQSRKGATESTADEMVRQARTYFTTCQINGGKTLDGAECYVNFKTGAGMNGAGTGEAAALTTISGAADSTKALKEELELTGEIPAYANITTFEISTTGEVKLAFTKDGFTCSNFDSELGTLNDEVVCTES